MPRFGFGKKKDKEEENPYAQQQQDQYSGPLTPFQEARANVEQHRAGGLPSGPAPPRNNSGGPPPPYQSSSQTQNAYYGNEKFGAQGAYGGNKYDSPGMNQSSARSARGPGGYGGMGGGDDDANAGALFGNARDRYVPPADGAYGQGGAPSGPPDRSNYGGGGAGGYNDPNKGNLFGNAGDRYAQNQGQSSNTDSYGGYGEARELTEEEREEQEYQDTKSQTKQLKGESLSSIQRSVAIARGAQATMQGTLVNLASQRERLANTERNLDQAAAQSRIAEDKTKELKKLNGSMFAIHHESRKAKQARDAALLERHQMERETRQETRRDAYGANQRMEEGFRGMRDGPGSGKRMLGKRDPNERSKYEMSDDDEESKAIEDGIDDGQEELADALSALKAGAVMMGKEVDDSIKVINRIGEKSDAVDDHVKMNRERLGRIR